MSGGLDRRTFLRFAAAGAVFSGTARSWPAAAATAAKSLRVYVLVVDGCRPEEITTTRMPRLAALRSAGANFPGARSLPVMETIPNHVMMMTGMRPDRTGVPANAIYDRALRAVRDMDRPSDIRVRTLLERLNATGRTTASVLSKAYLYGIFGSRATYRWEPSPLLPLTEHAPDAATMDALIEIVDGADPDLAFCNLGDIDRFGHADITGTTVQAARNAALASTDGQIGRFLDRLVATAKWSTSVLVVLADHSMDWPLPTSLISLAPVLEADPLLRGKVVIAQNGGADLLYWTGSAATRTAAVSRMSSLVRATPGVLSVHPPADLRLGQQAGDLVAFCRPGWRFSDPKPVSNPIPGNHGHPATEPIPFFVGGGHPAVRRVTLSAPARTVDVAPTVGSLFRRLRRDGSYLI